MVADTYSSILGTLVMGTGNDNNAWGDNCNNSVFAILENAIAKRATHAVTGGTLDLSTTIPPAGASSAIEMIQNFTGTLGSAQIVQIPNLSKLWLVNNACTLAGYTLTFKTSGGVASAAIPVGWCFVWCDGVSTGTCYAGLSTALTGTQFTAADGTVGAPGIAFTNALTTGLRHTGYATGTESNNPFTTTSSSATVSVAHTAHGLTTSDYVYFSGAAAVGGITPDGLYAVAGITSANAYTFTHSAAASSSTTGGGAAVVYKYLYSTANTGTAESLVAGGADVAHISPWGALFTGRLAATSDLIIGGLSKIVGALTIGGTFTGVAATLTGLLTGVTATLSGLLTLSSTSHMVMATGTTAQRPSSQTVARVRYNSTTNFLEYDNGTSWVACEPLSLRGYIDGLILSNGTDTVNDINIAAGVCRDSTNALTITISTAMGKQLDANWTAGGTTGTTVGGRDTAAGIANGTYHLYAVATAAGVADVYMTTATTAAAAITALALEPAGSGGIAGSTFIYARHIGSIVRTAAASGIVQFTQNGYYFQLTTPALDDDTSNTTSAILHTLSTIPSGIKVYVWGAFSFSASSANTIYISSPDQTDTAPSATAAPLAISAANGASSVFGPILTNTSQQVRVRTSVASATNHAVAYRYRHPRGQNI